MDVSRFEKTTHDPLQPGKGILAADESTATAGRRSTGGVPVMNQPVLTAMTLFVPAWIGLVACSSLNHTHTGSPALRMRMTAEEVIRVWSDTPCKVATQFHGNPAEAWGYEILDSPSAWPPRASPCERANYWVYFEKGHVVGWTPRR